MKKLKILKAYFDIQLNRMVMDGETIEVDDARGTVLLANSEYLAQEIKEETFVKVEAPVAKSVNSTEPELTVKIKAELPKPRRAYASKNKDILNK